MEKNSGKCLAGVNTLDISNSNISFVVYAISPQKAEVPSGLEFLAARIVDASVNWAQHLYWKETSSVWTPDTVCHVSDCHNE